MPREDVVVEAEDPARRGLHSHLPRGVNLRAAADAGHVHLAREHEPHGPVELQRGGRRHGRHAGGEQPLATEAAAHALHLGDHLILRQPGHDADGPLDDLRGLAGGVAQDAALVGDRGHGLALHVEVILRFLRELAADVVVTATRLRLLDDRRDRLAPRGDQGLRDLLAGALEVSAQHRAAALHLEGLGDGRRRLLHQLRLVAVGQQQRNRLAAVLRCCVLRQQHIVLVIVALLVLRGHLERGDLAGIYGGMCEIVRSDHRVELVPKDGLAGLSADAGDHCVGLGAEDQCANQGPHRPGEVIAELRRASGLLHRGGLRHGLVQRPLQVNRGRERLHCSRRALDVMQTVLCRVPLLWHLVAKEGGQELHHEAADNVFALLAPLGGSHCVEVQPDLVAHVGDH
mmetsp:Transcript_8667/g.22295  ORF Transcript_8667/g.22295 Transcript_8667/m.22295 type:complete len:401 (-) Transcript_8667:394-1596(-)